MAENRRFVLVRRPAGAPVPEDFAIVTEAIPVPPPGGFVVRNRFCSLDPAQRGWMDDAPSYMPPIALGDAVRATTVGTIHSSDTSEFEPGDWVMGLNAIEDYSVNEAGGFTMKVDVGEVDRPSRFLSAMGAVGLTGYFGLIEVANALAWNGPSGTYSHCWMSRALQSLRMVKPKIISSACASVSISPIFEG